MLAESSKQLSLIFLLVLFLVSTNTLAKGINIDSIDNVIVDGTHKLNARITYTFSDEVLDALEHGVALYFNILIKTSKSRAIIWDKIIKENMISYRLEYHPLSQRYLLTNLSQFKRYDFRTLESALNRMGEIDEYPLVNIVRLDANASYQAGIRVMLDNTLLPAPLRPLGFLSSKWKLSSPWKMVAIQQ